MTSSLNTALMRLAPRAEQNDPATLLATFVHAGPLFTLLSSPKHQVLYGRRGTGKTHALQYLGDQVRRSGAHAVYVDLRSLGSTGGMYTDGGFAIQQRATQLLVDVLLAVSNAVLNELANIDGGDPSTVEPAFVALYELQDTVSQVRVVGSVSREVQSSAQEALGGSSSAALTIGAKPSIVLDTRATTSTSVASSLKRTESGTEEHNVHFGASAQGFKKLLSTLPGKKLWILLDEWSVIPLELQPLLADFVRRCLLPIQGLVVKIGAIEQRSRFRVQRPSGDYLGIELGADVSADVDFDDFMVFNNDAEQSQTFFANLFFRHLQQDSGVSEMGKTADLIRSGFTQANAFAELVRAAEGVPRDAINIASLAAQRAADNAISMSDVRIAARK